MQYFKSLFEDITNEKISYTKDIIGNYYMYNYSLSNLNYLICSLKLSENICHIELMIFPDEMRKKGLGTKFVNCIKEWCYQNDYKIIELRAIQNSRNFWEKQGFTLINANSNEMKFTLKK